MTIVDILMITVSCIVAIVSLWMGYKIITAIIKQGLKDIKKIWEEEE